MLTKALVLFAFCGSLSAYGSVVQVNLDASGNSISDRTAVSSKLTSDGGTVIFATGTKLYQRNLASGQIQELDDLNCDGFNWSTYQTSLIIGLSNNDQILAYYDKCESGPHLDLWELVVRNLSTGERKTFVSSDDFPANWTLSPDGRYLAHLLDAQHFAVNDLQSGTMDVENFPAGSSSVTSLGFSLDGKYLSYSPAESTGAVVFVYDVVAKTQQEVDLPALPLSEVGCNLISQTDAVCLGTMTASPFYTTLIHVDLTTLKFDYISQDTKGQNLDVTQMIFSNDGRYVYFDAQNPSSPVSIDSIYRTDLSDGTVTQLIPHIVGSQDNYYFFAFASVNWTNGEKLLFGSSGCDVIPTNTSCQANAYLWTP